MVFFEKDLDFLLDFEELLAEGDDLSLEVMDLELRGLLGVVMGFG